MARSTRPGEGTRDEDSRWPTTPSSGCISSDGATPTSYRVETSGAGGQRTGTFELPFSSIELENYILRFGRTRQTVRRIDSPEMDLARTFGGKLFLALTTGPVGEGFRVAQGVAQGGGRNLRVTLSMTEAPELAAIPWEFLYDDPSFLATSARTPVVRCLEVERPAQPYEMTLPLRILAVESLPKGAATLATGSERALLTAALKTVTDLGAVQCDWLPDATLTSLNRQLRSQDYHILHFIGHGGFDKANKEGALLFEDENGLADLVGGDRLAAIVGERQSLRLVVLNSCEGARSDVSDPFSGVAGRLIERDVPAVIGMQFEITDRAAILFAREFYTVLAEGHAVDTAVSEARLAILADQNDVEWATPALFMRGSDAHLFSITDAAPIERVAPPLPPKTEGGGGGGGTTRGAGLRAWFRARPLAMPLLLAIVAILVVAVVAVVLLNGASTAALHLTTFPDRPGEMIVTGSGFREGETVELTMDGQLLDEVSVDPGGQFTKRITRPDTVLPGHFIELVATGLVSGRTASEFGAFGASAGTLNPAVVAGCLDRIGLTAAVVAAVLAALLATVLATDGGVSPARHLRPVDPVRERRGSQGRPGRRQPPLLPRSGDRRPRPGPHRRPPRSGGEHLVVDLGAGGRRHRDHAREGAAIGSRRRHPHERWTHRAVG